MNLKEQCAEDGITLAEGKKKYGLTHWKQVVETESQEEVLTIEEVVAELAEETKPIETESKEDLEVIRLSIVCLGSKSPHWDKRNLIGR